MKRLLVLYICTFLGFYAIAQTDTTHAPKQDTIILQRDTINLSDTLRLNDTTKAEPIPQPIDYSAQDSIYFDLDSMLTFLYSGVKLESQKMTLNAGMVKVDLKHSELNAYPGKDSTGKIVEKPTFSDGNDEFTAMYLKYNFKTRKGYARHVKTEQSEGYLHGGQVKIFPDGVTNIKQGKFTTCDLDHPHYYIAFTKAKYIPKKSIVTGFSYFVIEDIPFPIFLPFGYFPQKKYNSSGIVAPTFHQEQLRGYGLIGGGYYFALNDYMDLKITGDIFSKGSWGVTVASNFNVRYHFSGNFRFSYSHITNGEPYLVGSFVKNTYSINLTYRQSPKANPTSNFSISLNLDKGNNRQFNATDIRDFANNTTASSISYQKRFRGLPILLAINGNLTQNLANNTISGSLPNISLNMSRITPFKNIGYKTKAWYKDIGISFSSNFVNSFTTNDSLFFNDPIKILPLMKNGFRYSIPLSKSFKIFRYFNLSTGVNYTGRVYFSQIRKYIALVDSQNTVVIDTFFRPKHLVDFSASASLSTNLYGIFHINKFGLKAIRHKLTPTVSFVYKPDFSDEKWGYYLPEPDDTTGTRFYAIIPNPVVGLPSRTLQHALSFNISNNFEAKVFNKKDTVNHEKKITLIDNLSIRGSYNFAADSLNLSRISINASTRVLGSRINFSAILNPYTINEQGKLIDKFEVQTTGKLFRLEQMRLTANYSLSSKELKKAKQAQNKEQKKQKTKEYIPYHYFDPQWQFSTNYIFSLSKRFNVKKQSFDIILKQIVNFRFNIIPTPYWSFGIESGYDFNKMQLTNTTFRVYRDLHCWEMALQVTPFGRMRGYYFTLRIKSPMFNFFQIKKQRSWHDNSYYY